MTQWTLFGGVTIVVAVLVVLLARASARVLDAVDRDPEESDVESRDTVDAPLNSSPKPSTPIQGPRRDDVESEFESPPDDRPDLAGASAGPTRMDLSTRALYANVAFSHALFAAILLAAIYLNDVPSVALGVTADAWSTGWPAVGVGIALGLVLAFANTLAVGLARAFGADPSERLRELLAPDSRVGWATLLVVVLPIIAIFEELLFRAALIGGFATWLDVSAWLLVVLSSVAFGIGHVTQGRLGVVVTGVLGVALGTAFVVTNSLIVVIVAHYVINAVEFVVGEGLEWEPFGT